MMRAVYLTSIIAYLIIINLAIGQLPDQTVAILDFKPYGITNKQAIDITNRMREQVNLSAIARQVSRKTVNRIIKREGLKTLRCTTAQCLADIGQVLDVDYICSGELIKVADSTFTIDMNMVSVDSRLTTRSKKINVKGDLGDVALEMEILAWEMFWLRIPEMLITKKRLGRNDPRVLSMLKPRTPKDALIRSLLFPGLGSIHRGNTFHGVVFMGLEISFLALALYNQSQLDKFTIDKENNLNIYSTQTRADSIRKYVEILNGIEKDLEKVNENLFVFSISALGVWGVSLAHAYFADKKDDEIVCQDFIRFSYNPFRNTVQINWYF